MAVQSQYGRPAEAFTAGAGNIGNRKRMETVKDEAVRNDNKNLVLSDELIKVELPP